VGTEVDGSSSVIGDEVESGSGMKIARHILALRKLTFGWMGSSELLGFRLAGIVLDPPSLRLSGHPHL